MSFGRKRVTEAVPAALASAEAATFEAVKAPMAVLPATAEPPVSERVPEPPEFADMPQGPVKVDAGDPGAHDRIIEMIREEIFARLNVSAAVLGGREAMARQLRPVIGEIVAQKRVRMTKYDQDQLVERLLDDMFGLGPIEPLLVDSSITDILINGPKQVYVERFGKLVLTDVTFHDNDQLTNIAQRIASSIGRRVDEASPLVDARLADGSRVNIVTPPLALDGTCVSIRKFAKRHIGFTQMAEQGNMSRSMAKMLEIAGRCRLNVLISGGTGSGKTTLLNAMSGTISNLERIVTIEDAAELQLQQPHVVRLETRPMGLEGTGQIDQRQLVVNALRMRPDRIILGETRGAEAFDVLQAMNTGHDGSMTTIHANAARDALVRLENMVISGNPNLPLRFVRAQIVNAVNMVVQIARMRDGVRRVIEVVEIAGVEGEVVVTQELFKFHAEASEPGGPIKGRFVSSGLRPLFMDRAREYGFGEEVEALIAQD